MDVGLAALVYQKHSDTHFQWGSTDNPCALVQVEEIMRFLTQREKKVCRLVNKEFRDLIDSSFRLVLQITGILQRRMTQNMFLCNADILFVCVSSKINKEDFIKYLRDSPLPHNLWGIHATCIQERQDTTVQDVVTDDVVRAPFFVFPVEASNGLRNLLDVVHPCNCQIHKSKLLQEYYR
jgi:hypothetical protein